MKKNIIIIISIFMLLFIILLLNISKLNKINADINDTSSYKDIKVATFNIGSWKCGKGHMGATCTNSTNDKISELFENKQLDIIGIQEGATYDENNRPLSNNILELATLGEYNIRYVTPYQINAVLSKYPFVSNENIQMYNTITDCTYEHNGYMEKRAVIKTVININGIDISFYNTHLGHTNCNDIHFSDLKDILSEDENPIILTGDFNKVSDEKYIEYLKPLGFDVAAHDNNYVNSQTESYADSIFIKSNGKIEVLNSETINTYSDYSDHNLIMATLRIKNSINNLSIKNNVVIFNSNITKNKIEILLGNDEIVTIYSDGEEISDNSKIKTGNILKVDNKEYPIAILGDSNKDGNVDGADISRTYKIYRNIISNPTTVESIAADANEDDRVDGADISRIYKIYRGIYNLN